MAPQLCYVCSHLIHVYLSKWRSKSDTWLVGMHSLLVRRRTRAKKLTQAPSCLLALLASSAVLPMALPLVCSCVAPVERLSNSRPILVQYLSSTCPVLVQYLFQYLFAFFFGICKETRLHAGEKTLNSFNSLSSLLRLDVSMLVFHYNSQ